MYEDIIQQAMAEMVAGYEKIIERYLEEKDFAVFNTEIKGVCPAGSKHSKESD